MLLGAYKKGTQTSFQVVEALDFDGVLGEGSRQGFGDDFAGVKGTVDVFADPVEYYEGLLLTTVNITYNLPGDYHIGLGIYNTLGPSESVFVTGNGTTLDDDLTFAGTQIIVVPEPGTMGLLLLASTLLWFFLRRLRFS